MTATAAETRPGVIYIFERTDTGEMVVGRRLPPKGHDPRTWPRSGLGRLPDGYGSSTARPWMLAVRNKHGENIFRWTILAIYPAEMLKEIETRFIQHFKATLGPKCKNRAEDGTGMTGRAEWEAAARTKGREGMRAGGFQSLRKGQETRRANGFPCLKKGQETQRANGWVALKKGQETRRTNGWAALKTASPKGIEAQRASGWAVQRANGHTTGRIVGPVQGPISGARKALAAAIRRAGSDQRPWPMDNRRLGAAGLPANALPVVEQRQPKPGSKPAQVLAVMLAHSPLTVAEIASLGGFTPHQGRNGCAPDVRYAMDVLRARYGWPIICIRNRFYVEGHHTMPDDGSGPVMAAAA